MQEPAKTDRIRSASRSTDNLTRRVLGWMLLISLIPLVVMAAQGCHCAADAVVEKTKNHLLAVLGSKARTPNVDPLRETEKNHITNTQHATRRNITGLSAFSDISSTTLRKKTGDHGLVHPRLR